MKTDSKTRAKAGKAGELIASAYLILKGYRILRRRWRYKNMGEIDIIAARGNLLCFVEVKYRKKDREYAINPYQQARILRTASMFMKIHPDLIQGKSTRFDIILVAPWKFPYHLTEQWNWTDLEL